ncbi:MAG: amino acid adenylation domain-containing protein [Bacteroidota bacterium]
MTKQDNKNSNEDKKLTEQIHNECIHTILERQVELKPDFTALQFRQTGLTYSRLNTFINQFAYRLIDLGVHRGVCVGLAMERSFEMAIAIFAVLKAGGAYVPVDPEYPDDRIKFVFNDADVNILITQEKFSEKFRNYPQQLLKPDISDWAFGDFPATNPSVQVTPHDLAYILFTSGSTGKPKGVMVEQHSVVNLIRYIQRLYPIAEGDVVLLKSPYTFDGSVWELYGWLIPCGTLYIADPGIEKDPALLLNLIVSSKISFTFFVSSMLSVFLEYIELSGNKIVANNLKWVSVGGEVVSPSLVQRFYKIFGKYGTLLFNVYGPTETTVYATTYLCQNEDTDKTPVGKAVDNDFIYVLDESMKPVETMNEGEIFIGGEGVARGYLNRPELDSQKFLPNPFRAGEKIYATGDIGRFLPDGNLDFIGRRDFQVKMRGLRIELGEIENAMLAIPGIRDAAVIFTKDNFNDDSLIAFLVPETDSGIMTAKEPMQAQGEDRELIAVELQKSLPTFMIPSEFVVCRTFPLSENGKLDRKALKLPKNSGFARSGDLTPPSSPIEIWLAEMWQEVLSAEKISIHDSFFKLGGHSLKAASIAARISGKYGIEMPIKTIFENPTIFQLAKFLNDNIQPENRPLSLITAVERNESGYPLNANQLELWFLHKMDATRIMHNILFRLDIYGYPDIVVFQKAINALINSNEILRTAIRVQNGIPLQFLNEPYKITIPVVNLKELSQNAIELRLSEAEKTIGRQVFNLETGRLFSLDWFQTSEQSNIVYFCIHHIIFDGWSMFNFFNGFKLAYLNILSELPVDLHKPEIQNIDFAVYQKSISNQEKLTSQLEYWKKVFAKLPQPLILHCRKPFDLTKVAQAGKRIWWKTPENELTALKSFAVEHDCTLFALLLSIYKITLSAFSGNSDIVVGTPYANRRRQETEPLIGYFANMIALRDYISEDEPFSSFVKKVQLTSLDAFANVDLPFGQLVRSLGLITSPGRYPIFQVVFVLQNWAMPAMKFADIELIQKELGSGGVKIDIMLNAEETGNELECWLEYDLALFDEKPVIEMVNFFNQTIRIVIENPDIPIGKLFQKSQTIFNANPDGFSCVLIGETGLLTECGEILLRHGFVIKGLISPDSSCIAWGKNKGIGLVSGYEGIQSVDWNQVSFDYLFSIVNSKILKKETLLAVKKACINYHDSPLPYYAGVHATSWALMRGEEAHGVSWHVMTEETDAGGVVASARVEVSWDDTAFTLNARCFEAALQSFHQVIDTLRNDVELPSVFVKPLSYFSLHQKPFAAGVLDFRQPAGELYNMVRALNLGDRFDNRLASPKLLTNTGVFLVQRANHIVQKTTQKPGTVLGLKGQEVTIATADGVLAIKAITKLSGDPVPVADLFYDKAVNVKLPVPSQEKLLSIDNLVRKVAKNEPFWIRQLSLVSELAALVLSVSTGTWKTAEILVNSGFDRDLNAALMFFLASYSNSTTFTAE